jgi:hypothetical protein
MGTLGNGDGGPHDDLPELPPGWGPIRIPDDASELAEEAAQVRRELRERVRAPRPADGAARVAAPSFRRRTVAGQATEPASLRLPLLIMSAALLAAVVSLFAVAWPGDRRQPETDRTASTTTTAARTVPALDLLDERGATVALRALLPAAIMLTDGCDCADRAAAVATQAPAGVTVITLTQDGPATPVSTPETPLAVRRLRDPGGGLHDFLGLEPGPGVVPLILVGASGEIVRTATAASPLPDLAVDLALLPSR